MYLLLWPLVAVDARLDVIDARHNVGDEVDYVVRTALCHTPVSTLALERLLFGRQRFSLLGRQAHLVAR